MRTDEINTTDQPSMRAVFCHGVGGTDVMEWASAPRPALQRGEVLVKIAATAVNRADLAQRAGRYPVPPGTTPILGLECSGWVAAIGSSVEDVSAGDPVMALVTGGSYAEYVAVPAAQLMPVPQRVPLPDAAALPEALCTVYANLVLDGDLSDGQFVLIHGGGSGIGTAAIQIVRALGGHAIVTVGSERKADLCRDLGAEAAINYKEQDFAATARAATAGRGVDLVLDCVGGSYIAKNLDVLADDGKVLVIGLQGGSAAEFDLGPLMRRRLTVRGSTLRARPARQKAAIVAQTVRALTGYLESGQIEPVIDQRFPISAVAEAHDYVEAGKNFGKVLLTVSDQQPDTLTREEQQK